MDDGKFAPSETLTREQAIMIIARLNGDDYLNYANSSPFDDIAASHWSSGAIAWGKATGVTSGIGNNMFAPARLSTCEQFEVMLMRHYNIMERWSGIDTPVTRAGAAEMVYQYVILYE